MKGVDEERRLVLRCIGGSVGALGLAGCTGSGGESTPTQAPQATEPETEATETPRELTQMHTLEVEGTETVPVWLFGVQNGVWEQHGIDLSVEIAPFPKKSRAVVADLAKMGTMSLPQVPPFIAEGEPLTMLGTKQNLYNQIFVRDSSDIESVEDLAGKQVAIPPLTSTTTNVVKAMVEGQLGFDLLEDPAETRPTAPPLLLPLLEKGDVDAVLLFSGDTISATVDPDIRSIFDPFVVWREATGFTPPVSNWAVKRPWLEEHPDVALRFLAGWEDAVQLFKDNVAEAVKNYGRLGGVSTEEEADLIKQWLSEDKIVGPFEFTQDLADNQWEMLELIAEAGTLEEFPLPDRDEVFTTTAELEELRDQ